MQAILHTCKKFRCEDGGAVTADWVVLTALVLALAYPVVSVVRSGEETLARETSDALASMSSE